MPYKISQVNRERFRSIFDTLSGIGITNNEGVNRVTFSDAHLEIRNSFRAFAVKNGLDFKVDNAGNHIAYLKFDRANSQTLLIGSHLDSVPNGGKFDGVLGVSAGLEVLLTIKDYKISLPFNLEVVDFTDEEGTYIGTLGSKAFSGKLAVEDFLNLRGNRDTFNERLKICNLTRDDILDSSRNADEIAGYIELHIEQGSILENCLIDIGIVTSIVGICSYEISFIGRADHAGTTPMTTRLDASQGASQFTLAARNFILEHYPGCVCNIGNMQFSPGIYNIVPEKVKVFLEFRAPDDLLFEELEEALLNLAQEIADKFHLSLHVELVGKIPPAIMDEGIQNLIKKSSDKVGAKFMKIASGAGHDAQSFADLCPTGMIFVPSFKGVSHSPSEFTHFKDCENGVNILLHTVLGFASQMEGK